MNRKKKWLQAQKMEDFKKVELSFKVALQLAKSKTGSVREIRYQKIF